MTAPLVISSRNEHFGIAARLNISYASALDRYFWHAMVRAPPSPMQVLTGRVADGSHIEIAD
jgi:hypothetical protein